MVFGKPSSESNLTQIEMLLSETWGNVWGSSTWLCVSILDAVKKSMPQNVARTA